MPTLARPTIPTLTDLSPDAVSAEAARLTHVAESLERFAADFADRAKPFEQRAAEYRAAAAQLRKAVLR